MMRVINVLNFGRFNPALVGFHGRAEAISPMAKACNWCECPRLQRGLRLHGGVIYVPGSNRVDHFGAQLRRER